MKMINEITHTKGKMFISKGRYMVVYNEISIQEVNKSVEILLNKISDSIPPEIKEMRSFDEKREGLDYKAIEIIKENKLFLDPFLYCNLGVREIVFHELQKTNKINLGICEFFVPNYKKKIEELLTIGKTTLNSLHRCTYTYNTEKEPYPVSCEGSKLDKGDCVIYHPNLKKIVQAYVNRANSSNN